MKHSREYVLPIGGLSLGNHEFSFLLDADFFGLFDYSEVSDGKVEVLLKLEKKENMIDLHFAIKGFLVVACDRCADDFDEPVEGESELILKFGETYEEESDEIIIIPVEQHQFDLSQLLYEYTVLLLPIRRIHPDNEKGESNCNQEVLNRLNQMEAPVEDDPRWEALKNLKSDN